MGLQMVWVGLLLYGVELLFSVSTLSLECYSQLPICAFVNLPGNY